MKPGEAIVFDLYGTLLHVEDSSFSKAGARLFGAPRREWTLFLRDVLLVRPFADLDAFVESAVERFRPSDPEGARRAARTLIERELASVVPEPALGSVLGFLRRREVRLGLLTNSASPFREPAERFGVLAAVDAAVFSCDAGRRKPDPEIYRQCLAELGAAPERTAMVGDSLANDVEAPRRLGWRALRLGGPAERSDALAGLGELAWVAEIGDAGPLRLVEPGQPIELAGRRGRLGRIDLLPDGEQGRYNLVAACAAEWSDGSIERVFLKRFRYPEAARVELFVRRLLAEIGVESRPAALLEGPEPLLLSAEAHGVKLGTEPPDPLLAREIGRHGASAFLFANADLRPRNTFLERGADGRPRLTVVDYEYTLFDRAIDLSREPDRYEPASLVRFSDDELRARGAKRVVNRAAIQRTRRAFFDHRQTSEEALAAFRAGWRSVHRAAQAAAPRLEQLLRERIASDPPLVVGTAAYRRALLPLDVDDLLERVGRDPDEACGFCF